MVFEYISVVLAIAAGITGVLAWVYRKGKSDAIDEECALRIERKIDSMKIEGDKVHGELKAELHEVHSKIDKLQGSFEIFQKLIPK